MSLVLGIDTGGTYTDGVVFDRVAREVLAKAKSRTTREDLSIGITRVIEAVEFDDARFPVAITLKARKRSRSMRLLYAKHSSQCVDRSTPLPFRGI